MRIHLGCDHAGFDLKTKIALRLKELGSEPVDHGSFAFDPDDDYPRFCFAAAEAVAADTSSRGIVIGGSGNGEAMAANKVRGIRCALVYSEETALLARLHNDANVMSLGARSVEQALALRLVEIFVTTPFRAEERHARRLAQLAAYEQRRL